MSVLINFKICDNAEECNGIAACPTGALSWNETDKTIEIDDSKCTSCGICEESCGVGAIKVAKDKEEHLAIEKEFSDDPRKVTDLFLDRYGAQPVLPAFLIQEDKFEREVLKSAKLTVVELFKDSSINCLLKSIPITELLRGLETKYRKLEVTTDQLIERYEIEKLPALLFFNKGKLVGKIEGFFPREKKKEIIEKINKIVEKQG